MTKKIRDTPMLDELENGPWPSFVTGLKRLANDESKPHADMMKDLLGQLEHSYETRKGFWKGGTVGVYGYGGGVIPRFSEVAEDYPDSKEFHTLRIQPPAGMHYDTATLRKMCDIWEESGTGLIALHGQSGDIMFQGCSTEQVQEAFDGLNEIGADYRLDYYASDNGADKRLDGSFGDHHAQNPCSLEAERSENTELASSLQRGHRYSVAHSD